MPKQDSAAELEEPGRCNKLPRISDVDMFSSTEVVERQHLYSNPTDNGIVRSSDNAELVSPSSVVHSAHIQNDQGLMGFSAALDHESGGQNENVVGNDSDAESLNDVEPSGSESSSSASRVLVSEDTTDRCPRTIVTLVNSSPVISRMSSDRHERLISEMQQPSASSTISSSSRLAATFTPVHDSRVIAATTGQSLLDDDLSQQSEQSIADVDNTQIVCDLVSQPSTTDQSYHSCAATNLNPSQVNMYCRCYYIYMVPIRLGEVT